MSTIVVVDPARKAPEDLLVFSLEEPNRGFFVKLLEDTGSEFIEIQREGKSIAQRLLARAVAEPVPVRQWGGVPPPAKKQKQVRPSRKGHSAGTSKRKRCPKCGMLLNRLGFATHLASHDPAKRAKMVESAKHAREVRAEKRAMERVVSLAG